ncbi:hypothetical protein APED_22180 [Acanthopleuribacter pedis]
MQHTKKQGKKQAALDTWLLTEVGPAYDALKADPTRALTGSQVRAHLADVRAKADGPSSDQARIFSNRDHLPHQ